MWKHLPSSIFGRPVGPVKHSLWHCVSQICKVITCFIFIYISLMKQQPLQKMGYSHRIKIITACKGFPEC